MAESAVLYEVTDHIATIKLNRPDNRNSMTREVLDGFLQGVANVKSDPDLRCAIITGTGRSFCAGADFKDPARGSTEGRPIMPNERSFEAYRPFLSVLEIEVPVIAAMNGHAIGGGMGLALVCDIRVANQDAKYGSNFTKLGLHPGMATTYLLPRIVGLPRAVELLLTGRIITGAEAAELGLANYALPADQVWDKSWELAQEIAACAPIANRWTKRSIYRNIDWNPREAAYREAELQSRTIETEDNREGIAALLEKRTPQFKGR